MTLSPTFGCHGWPAQAIEILEKMRAAGASNKAIAAALGISRSAVGGKARRLRVPRADDVRYSFNPRHRKPQLPRAQAPKAKRVRPPRLPKMAAPEPAPLPPCDPVPLLALLPWHCRSPVKARGPDGLAMCCGQKVTSRLNGAPSAWCEEHYRLYVDLERMERYGKTSPRN